MNSNNNNNTPPSEIEKFISKLPCPVFITVFSSFIFIYLIGFIFSRGIQVYPIYNEIIPGDDCPECRVFNDTKASITERQFRIIYQVVSNLELTRANAWRLLRIKIYGPIFSQEMRANTDNCGLYAYGTKHSAMHFELIQEGPTTVELYCLDNLLLKVSSDVTRYNRDTQATLFHTSLKEVSNICRVEESMNENFVFFSQSNVYNFTNDKQYAYIPRLLHKREHYSDYINNSHATVINNAFRIDYTFQDLLRMPYHDFFEKVILVIFVQSHFGQTIVFSYHKEVNANNLPFYELLRRVTDGKLKSSPNNFKNVFCYQKLTTIPNYRKIQELTENEYEMLRSSAVSGREGRGNKIYLASNFRLATELNKDPNIYFYGEEKIAPPTQSPSPSPSASPEPTQSPSPSPEPTQSPSPSPSQSATPKPRQNTTEGSTKRKSTNTSRLTNKTARTKSKLSNTTKSDSKPHKANSSNKNSTISKNKKSNTSNITDSKLHKSIPKLKSNLTTKKQRSNSTLSSDITTSNTTLTGDDISSPVLLSEPEFKRPEDFSLQEKIEILASAKALIAVDNNEEVLHAFWMPRESPLILIQPPMRSIISKAAQRINATGRKIIYLQGDVDGIDIPEEYGSLAEKCMSNEETANSNECDSVFEEMKFKFDTNKVLEIVNNL